MSAPLVVVQSLARKTTRGRFLLAGTSAFVVLWLVLANEALRGTPVEARPPGWIIFGVAFAPFVLTYLGFLRDDVARRLGLIEALPAKAAMDATGLTLTIDGTTLPRIPWNVIAAVEPSGRDWRLGAGDGSELARIPYELMHPPASWTDAPTFAELVVQVRPDRYALRGERFEPGLTEFSIRQPNDLVGRPRGGLQKRVLALGIIMAVVAFVLLVATTPTS